jgi:hypothetical protein
MPPGRANRRSQLVPFWARFQDLLASETDLLCIICNHLSIQDCTALRGVNRAMRKAMNSTVTSIRCNRATVTTNTLRRQQAAFPNLRSLAVQRLSLTSNGTSWRSYFEELADGNDRLVAGLRHLSLTVPTKLVAAADASAIWELLTRCGNNAATPACRSWRTCPLRRPSSLRPSLLAASLPS